MFNMPALCIDAGLQTATKVVDWFSVHFLWQLVPYHQKFCSWCICSCS